MGLSALGAASAFALLGYSAVGRIVSSMFYPLGFIVVIVDVAICSLKNRSCSGPWSLRKEEFWNTNAALGCRSSCQSVVRAICRYSDARLDSTQDKDRNTLLNRDQLGTAARNHPIRCLLVRRNRRLDRALAAWMVSGSHSITRSMTMVWMSFIVGLSSTYCILPVREILVEGHDPSRYLEVT